MFDKIVFYFLIFFIYSVIGYICEVSSICLKTKKLSFSRGFLIGPYLPIFGFGGLIITLLLNKYVDEPITVFILGTFYSCLLEYLTSYFMERLFHLRWWDYSHNKFNINGRICLETGFLFGVGSLVINYITNPLLFNLFRITPLFLIRIIGIILFIIMLLDTIISVITITKLEIDTTKFINKDATKEIKEKITISLHKYRFFHSRLLEAFPNITKNNTKIAQIKDIIKKKKGEANEK